MNDELRLKLNKLSDVLRNEAIVSSNLDDTLRLARLYARLHWDNISGFFGDREFEEQLFQNWGSHLFQKEPDKIGPTFLHVATQIYNQGGHSRLFRRLVSELTTKGSQKLVVTNPRRDNDLFELPVDVQKLFGSPSRRCLDLINIGSNAGTIVLHTHPDDSVAAIAARALRKMGKRVLFVNHADHVFSLGPSAADVVLEICMTGWRTTRDRRNVQAQSFMGIPLTNSDADEKIWQGDRSGPIVSMGGPGKFQPDSKLSFPSFLGSLLPRIENEVILIGPSIKDSWWGDLHKRFAGRIRLMGTRSPDEVRKIVRTASCYIDSFPLDGGTAYPQMAMIGIPCFGPNAANAPGVSPADRLRFTAVSDMEEAIVAYLKGGAYPFSLKEIQDLIKRDFSDGSVARRVADARDGILHPILPYLENIGQRNSDYNAERWENAGILNIPKRQWRGLSFGARQRLLQKVRAAGLPKSETRILAYRICTNWI